MTKSELVPLLKTTEQGILLPCWVQPRASKTAIAGIHGDALKISLSAPPVDGKANTELCKFFAKLLGLPKSSVELASGAASRKKVILLRNINTEKLLDMLADDN